MPKRSFWDSAVWKFVLAIAVILSIVCYVLQIRQVFDFWNLLILPAFNFFLFPIPLYCVPLTIIAVIVILFMLANIESSKTASVRVSDLFDKSDILDDDYIRNMAVLCQTPQTPDSLRQKYDEFSATNDIRGGYSFEDCLKHLQHRGLLTYEAGKWTVTQKALDYIKKYHGC